MSANTRIVGAARSGLAVQKAFLAIILVILVHGVWPTCSRRRSTNFFSEANFINVLKSALDLPHPGDGRDGRA